jgi:hypothetical protein
MDACSPPQTSASTNAPGSAAGAAAAATNAAAAATNLLLRKHQIASIFQHYYPEGDWGYVILVCTFLVQVCAHGIQLSYGVLGSAIVRRWRMSEDNIVDIGRAASDSI